MRAESIARAPCSSLRRRGNGGRGPAFHCGLPVAPGKRSAALVAGAWRRLLLRGLQSRRQRDHRSGPRRLLPPAGRARGTPRGSRRHGRQVRRCSHAATARPFDAGRHAGSFAAARGHLVLGLRMAQRATSGSSSRPVRRIFSRFHEDGLIVVQQEHVCIVDSAGPKRILGVKGLSSARRPGSPPPASPTAARATRSSPVALAIPTNGGFLRREPGARRPRPVSGDRDTCP